MGVVDWQQPRDGGLLITMESVVPRPNHALHLFLVIKYLSQLNAL